MEHFSVGEMVVLCRVSVKIETDGDLPSLASVCDPT